MQNANWIITGVLALLAIGAYIFKAGVWAQERVSRDEKFATLEKRFDRHVEDDNKWKHDHNSKINQHDSRIVRVEADRRIVIFPRRRQDEFDDPEG